MFDKRDCGNCRYFKYESVGKLWVHLCKHFSGPGTEVKREDKACGLWEHTFNVEELVLQTLYNMEWILDFCITKLSQKPYSQKETPKPYHHGADDSTFDYIPNGIDTMAWIARVFGMVFDVEGDLKADTVPLEVSLPYVVGDCVPGVMCDKIKKLASTLSYEREELGNAGFFELELPEKSEDIFVWEEVLRGLLSSNCETDKTDDGLPYSYLYLGSIFNIMPSGKYYLPFACSNVTEAEVQADREFNKKLEAQVDKHGLFLFGGEGDPTDIFVGKMIGEEGEEECTEIDLSNKTQF